MVSALDKLCGPPTEDTGLSVERLRELLPSPAGTEVLKQAVGDAPKVSRQFMRDFLKDWCGMVDGSCASDDEPYDEAFALNLNYFLDRVVASEQ